MLYMNPFAFARVRKKRTQNLIYHGYTVPTRRKNCYTVPIGDMEMKKDMQYEDEMHKPNTRGHLFATLRKLMVANNAQSF